VGTSAEGRELQAANSKAAASNNKITWRSGNNFIMMR
jgi:hypothetical protein